MFQKNILDNDCLEIKIAMCTLHIKRMTATSINQKNRVIEN
jgi:hypothetical protein